MRYYKTKSTVGISGLLALSLTPGWASDEPLQMTKSQPNPPEIVRKTYGSSAPLTDAFYRLSPSGSSSAYPIVHVGKGFGGPAGLALDSSGNLYVTDFLRDRVDKITPSGRRTVFCSKNLCGPVGIVADAHDNFYVANYSSGSIFKIDNIGKTELIADGFSKPYFLLLDPSGDLLVTAQGNDAVYKIELSKPASMGSKQPAIKTINFLEDVAH